MTADVKSDKPTINKYRALVFAVATLLITGQHWQHSNIVEKHSLHSPLEECISVNNNVQYSSAARSRINGTKRIRIAVALRSSSP